MRFCEPIAIYKTYKFIKLTEGVEAAEQYLKKRMGKENEAATDSK